MMVVGDSISQGSSGDYTWRYRLYKNLVSGGLAPQFVGPYNSLFNNVTNQQSDCTYADPKFETAHDAIWGRMLDDAKTTIGGEVASSQPGYLMVLLGINDIAWGRTDSAGEEVNMRTLITNARSSNPNLKILIGRLLPTKRAETDTDFASLVTDVNRRLDTVAADMSTASSPVVVVDDGSEINTDQDLWDGTHPNAAGEIKIAAAFSNALATKFSLGSGYPKPYPTVPVGPQTPPVLTVTGGQSGLGQMSWTAPPGADGFLVSERNVTLGDPDFSQLPNPLKPTDSPWTNTSLIPGNQYELKIQAFKGVNGGALSNTVAFTSTGTAPTTPPTNLKIVAGDGQATLSWDATPNATAYYIYRRNVTAGESAFTKLPYPVPASPWTDGLLINGSTYEFKVQAINGALNGGTTAAVSVTPTGPAPSAATNLSAAPGDGQVTLSWTPAEHATGYYVWVKNLTAGENDFTRLPYPVSGGSWTDDYLVNGAEYQFKLQSVNGVIAGGTTAAVNGTPTGPTPSAPTNLSAAPGDRRVTLSWTPAEHATGYYVWVKNLTAGENDFTRLPYPVSGSSWDDQNLVAGADYQFKLQSLNGLIEGGTTGAVTGTPTGSTPSAPTGLTATSGDHTAKLTWTAAAGTTGYYVWMKNVSAGDTSFTRLPYPVSGTSWTAGKLVNGGSYQFKLQSLNGMIEGTATAAVSVTPTGPAPSAPTNFKVLAADRAAVLTWSLPANATCVYIYIRNVTGGDSQFTKLPYPVCDDSFTVNDLVNGATYQFKIQAYNDLIAGSTTSAVAVVPVGPGAAGPDDLTVMSGNNKAILRWDQASHATSYYIWQLQVTPTQGSWSRLPYPVSGGTFTVGSLVNGAQYQYKVQSVDGLQPGGYSNTVSVTPLGPTPQAPGDLSVSGNWRGTATLDWTSTATATSYYIYVSDNGSAWTQLQYPVTSGPWTAGYLLPGHTYSYQLRAVNGLQFGSYSNVASVHIPLPPAPSGMTVVQNGPYKAYLDWNAVDGADGYYVYTATTAPGDFHTPNSWSRLPYPVTKSRLSADYLLSPGVYWYKVAAIKYGVEGPASGAASIQPLMENPNYYYARMTYFVDRPNGLYKSAVLQAGGGGSDSDMFMARAPILNGDWFSNIIGDGRGFSSELYASSRVSLVWEPKSGKIGAMAQPSCPLISASCKSALNFQQTGTSIPLQQECDSILTICGGSYSYNKMGASGGGGATFLGFQFANSYASIAGWGIPGAIDGTLNVAQTGGFFKVTLIADKYPSWEFLRIPHYTTNGVAAISLFGTRSQKTLEYLCTRCHGQSTYTATG